MRVIVFFDLPTETSEDKREYRRFRKELLALGFMMMQESVYSKIVLNNTAAEAIRANVQRISTTTGLIQMLTVTERQYEGIEMIVGEGNKSVVDSDERFVVL